MESQKERSSALACWPRCMPGTGAMAGGAQDGDHTPCAAGEPAAGRSAAGTRRFRAAYLTVWGVSERRTDRMDVHMQMAEAVRQACIAAALQAYDDAGVSGLCHEGRWEYAVEAMRGLPLRPLIEALLRRGRGRRRPRVVGDERRDPRRGAGKGGGDIPPWPPEHGRDRPACMGAEQRRHASTPAVPGAVVPGLLMGRASPLAAARRLSSPVQRLWRVQRC